MSSNHQDPFIFKLKALTFRDRDLNPHEALGPEDWASPVSRLASAKAEILALRDAMSGMRDQLEDWERAHIQSLPDLSGYLRVDAIQDLTLNDHVLRIRPECAELRFPRYAVAMPDHEENLRSVIEAGVQRYSDTLIRLMYSTLGKPGAL